MSIRFTSLVWAMLEVSGGELVMLLALADMANDSGCAWPSVATLAKRCRVTERHANRLLAQLQDAGVLEVHRNEGRYGTNIYRILLQPGMTPTSPLAAEAALTPPSSPPDACVTPESTPSPVATVSSDLRVTLTPTSVTPDTGVTQPLTPVSPESSVNHQEPSVVPRKRAGGVGAIELPAWVPTEPWADFVEMRRAIRKPMTPKAQRLNLSELEKLRDDGHDPRAVLEQSVANSYQGLFPIKADSRRCRDPPAKANPMHADKQFT